MLGTGLEIALISRAGLAAGALSSVEVSVRPAPHRTPRTASRGTRASSVEVGSPAIYEVLLAGALFPDRVVAEMCCGYAMQFIGNKSFLFKADQDTLTECC